MNCVESSWLIRGLNQQKQWWPFFFQYIHRQMRLHLHLIPRGCAACESELISICNDIQLIKKCLQVYRTMILLCSTEAFLMTTAITNLFIFNVCSVHMHHRCKVAKSQSHNLFSAFPRRNTLMAVKKISLFSPKVLQSVLHCENILVRMSLVGGKETSGQGMQRHFPGRVTKAALLDLQQGKHVCESSLGTVQNTIWTDWSVYSFTRLIMAMATRYTRFNRFNLEKKERRLYVIDGFLCEHAVNMISRPINRSVNFTHWNK